MTDALLAWRDDPAVQTVLIDHAGERGFCAGGDIRTLADSAASDGVEALRFFHTEYRLDHLISIYPKPVVAIMDGITMGGGAGVSLPARYRIATERTRFAMPETGIGLFPDVGAGWFLPRLPGASGAWIAYTGARLAAFECLEFGLATHRLPASNLVALRTALTELPAEAAVAKYACRPQWDHPGIDRARIDRLFGAQTLEECLEGLQSDDSGWAREQLAAMQGKSPLSSKITERLLRMGVRAATLADDLVVEYRLASRIVMRPDFHEGVRAVLVDKDNAPRWSPASLAEVSEALVDEMFAPLPPDQEWTPLQA